MLRTLIFDNEFIDCKFILFIKHNTVNYINLNSTPSSNQSSLNPARTPSRKSLDIPLPPQQKLIPILTRIQPLPFCTLCILVLLWALIFYHLWLLQQNLTLTDLDNCALSLLVLRLTLLLELYPRHLVTNTHYLRTTEKTQLTIVITIDWASLTPWGD